jgi:eukaryotic-like serine/threonine-protein kinase
MVLAKGGATDEARAILRRVDALPDGTWGKLSAQTRLELALGDTARALAAMERAAAGDGDLVPAVIFSARTFDPVRQSPRFAAVARKFNLDVARLTAPDGGRSR